MDLEALAAYGANVEEGLTRCMGNEGFYLKMVDAMRNDAHFDELGEALEARDLDRAFETAHALKGGVGNLALTPLYEPVVEITELLRSRTDMDYSELYAKIVAERERLLAL
jgi:HPt (histidine-containing phosphotransfer) domain-containing protein